MDFITAYREWYWRGSPARRALLSLVVCLVTAAGFFPFDVEGAKLVLMLGLNWTVGGYAMDKAYVNRLSHGARRPA